MSLRLKLLLLGLATLILPWGGCRYARQMEAARREGERNSLQAVAQTIAASLQGRTDLLYRAQPAPPEPQPSPYDLQPVTLNAPPFLDGYADEWPSTPGIWRHFTKDGHRFGILTGVYERMLYVLLDVEDSHLVFDTPGANPLDPSAIGDRVWLGMQDPTGDERQFFIAATGPGSVTGRRVATGEYGQQLAADEPRIVGAWQPSPTGYRVELRIPLSMIGRRFGVLIDDRDERGATPVSYGTLYSDNLHTVGRLIVSAPELTGYLAQFMRPGLRLSVTTPSGRLLAQADALAQVHMLEPQRGILARFYRRFVDQPGHTTRIVASAPIYDRDHHKVIGSLTATETAEAQGRLFEAL